MRAGSATLAGSFAATPALRIDGDRVPGGTLDQHFLCDVGDALFIVGGLPPQLAIPTPPFEGALRIFPFVPLLLVTQSATDDFDLLGTIPNDPSLSGREFLIQALVGPQLGGRGKSGSWTNCGDVVIQ